ncbi:MAG: HD-GYP domain-containing protein [Spirochaetota bacterium]|nr:HD-GYP domain-containing protein [Spirochaetota bacterium]
MEEEKEIKKVEVNVEFMKPGIVLAYPAFDMNGNQINTSHKPFTKEDIQKLVDSGIKRIYYVPEEEKYKKSALQEYLDRHSYKGPRTIKLETQHKAVDIMSKLVKTIKDCLLQIDSKDISELTDAIASDINNSESEIVNLLDIVNYDDYIYTHSLNVGVISMIFAKKLKMDEELIRQIGVGGFLHDIGTIKLPQDIIHKEHELTPQEFTLIQEHPEIGYDMVKKDPFLYDVSREIVLHHHERIDGSGYPNGLKGNEIKDHVWIVAMADYFDAFSTPKPYRGAKNTEETLQTMYKNAKLFKDDMLHRFIKEMVILFRENSYYDVDSYVLLNTNELAKVISINNNNVSRPKVKIISNQHGKRLTNPISVDLEIDFSRKIIRKMGG